MLNVSVGWNIMQIMSNITKKRKIKWKSSCLITLLKKSKNLRNYLDRIVTFCLLGEFIYTNNIVCAYVYMFEPLDWFSKFFQC
jgi:hypothetical protein